MTNFYKNILFIFISCLIATFTKALTKEMGKIETVDNDWWKHAVIYQIYPRSFMDSNGDGIGDLRGIIEKLPHLADIGVNATWLSPIFASPMIDFGYDIADFKSIQTDYGTLEDFEQLIKEAKRLNIKILLDFVPNHTSDQCEWFQKSVKREAGFEDFYIWSAGKIDDKGQRQPPNNWRSVFFGSAWTWHAQRRAYYLHQFTKEQPDLNFRNPKVLAAMDDVINFWLDKGISGFRVDAINHLFESENLADEPLSGKTLNEESYDYTDHVHTLDLPEVLDVVQHWRSLLGNYTAKHGGARRIMMTEAYTDIKKQMDYYEDINGAYGAHFPFNFLLITDLNAQSDARDFVFNIQKWLIYMPHGHIPNWVMGNHDKTRVATRFGEKLTDAMNMLLMTLPGVAVTYNGEEIGMQDNNEISWQATVDPFGRNAGALKYKEVSRDPVRTPFQWNAEQHAGFSTAPQTWLPVHKNYVDLNLAAQKSAAKSHYKVYKALTALRQLPILREGSFEAVVLNRAVFMLKRELKRDHNQHNCTHHETLITIINLGVEAQKVDLTEFCYKCKIFKVLVADSKSKYENGHEIMADKLQLEAQMGLVGMLQCA